MIIINNMDFGESRMPMSERTGSDKDEKRLLETFTGFGFVCETKRNRKGLVCLHW